jgi:DNA polymerase/3'-5' exonuclease PolX
MSPLSVPTRYRLDEAERIAETIVVDLAAVCERICIAGSIRRRAQTVGDVELVVIPGYRQQVVPLFDDVAPLAAPVNELDEALNAMLAAGSVKKRPARSGRTSWGPSDKRLLWCYGGAPHDWIAVDIFGARPETWGAKFVLRTGPWEFSRRLVTHRGNGRDGVLAHDLLFREGRLWRFDPQARRVFVPTPDEETLFRELGLPFVPPEHRTTTTFRAGRGAAR